MLNLSKLQKGASMVEYALCLALVAVVVIGSLTALGIGVDNTFTAVGAVLP